MMHVTTRLDFLGIGAQKAGTTSLHEYLRTHPELFLPEAKEQPFFTRDEAYLEGWDRFADVAFHGAPPGRLCGKITPHYLAGPVAWREPARCRESIAREGEHRCRRSRTADEAAAGEVGCV